MTTGIVAQNVQLGSSSTFNVAKSITQVYHPISNATGSTGFDLLVQNVAKVARHDSSEMAAAVGTCHPGTRVDILKELEEWATATSYSFPIKWMHGTVGIGKSAILQTMCRYLSAQGLLMAAFLLPRTGDCRHRVSQNFIPTLAYELSRSIPETRPHIEEAVRMDPLIFSQCLQAQARALIVSPLHHLHQRGLLSAPHPRVIVVDGLDECSIDKQVQILQTFTFIYQQLPIPLAILIGSRSEPYIRDQFNRPNLNNLSEQLVLEGSSVDAELDIRKYYNDSFEGIRRNHNSRSSLPMGWPCAEAFELLVRKTCGHFGFATTAIGFIESIRHNPVCRLDIILGRVSSRQKIKAFSKLDLMYTANLKNIDPEIRPRAIRILGVLLLLMDGLLTLTPKLIERLLSLEEGDVQHLLFDVQSLVHVEPEGFKLVIIHDSLREFLFDKPRANDLYIYPPAVYEDLAKNSIFLLIDGVEEDLQALLLDNILTFFQKAEPTEDLKLSIEKGIENLSKIYLSTRRLVLCPLFYEAVKSSKLEDATILSERILRSYTRLLSDSIYLCMGDDPPTACLALVSLFRGKHEEDKHLYRMILDIFDRYLEDAHVADLENGLRLQDMVPIPMEKGRNGVILPSDPILRAMELSRTTISRLVHNMPEYYSKTARYLLGYMFTDSARHVPATDSLLTVAPTLRKFCFGTIMPQVFPDVLAASPPDLELFQYITANKLSEGYQEFEAIVNAIHDYIKRTTEVLRLSSSPPISGKDTPPPLTSEALEELRIHALGHQYDPALGNAHGHRITQDMQKSLGRPIPKKAKSLP